MTPLADWTVVTMMKAMCTIDANSTSSHCWRIEHGAVDADTSLPISVILSTKLIVR